MHTQRSPSGPGYSGHRYVMRDCIWPSDSARNPIDGRSTQASSHLALGERLFIPGTNRVPAGSASATPSQSIQLDIDIHVGAQDAACGEVVPTGVRYTRGRDSSSEVCGDDIDLVDVVPAPDALTARVGTLAGLSTPMTL